MEHLRLPLACRIQGKHNSQLNGKSIHHSFCAQKRYTQMYRKRHASPYLSNEHHSAKATTSPQETLAFTINPSTPSIPSRQERSHQQITHPSQQATSNTQTKTTTMTIPSDPSRPSACTHHPLNLQTGTRYKCHCSHSALLGTRSNSYSISLLHQTDGTPFPGELQTAFWCYCSDGPGHRPFQIPGLKVTRGEKKRRDEVQWRSERKALAKGRDCLALRRGARWLVARTRKQGQEQGVGMGSVRSEMRRVEGERASG